MFSFREERRLAKPELAPPPANACLLLFRVETLRRGRASAREPASRTRPAHAPVAEAEEQPKSSPEPAPQPPRRAIRVEPKRGTHGPNRGGESERSWERPEDRNPTKVPLDVADFLREEW